MTARPVTRIVLPEPELAAAIRVPVTARGTYRFRCWQSPKDSSPHKAKNQDIFCPGLGLNQSGTKIILVFPFTEKIPGECACFFPDTCSPAVRPHSLPPVAACWPRFSARRPLLLVHTANMVLLSGVEEWWEWWGQDGRAPWGAVRCGPEECRTVWGSAKRFLVVTGGPVRRVARTEPTWNDRSGTRNATARGRHGA